MRHRIYIHHLTRDRLERLWEICKAMPMPRRGDRIPFEGRIYVVVNIEPMPTHDNVLVREL